MFYYRYQSHVRYNILITFPKFKKNKIALAIKNFQEVFQLILGYTMCEVCMVRFHGCLICDTTSPSWNNPQSQELVILFTCVALAKAGLVVGPLRPSGRPSVRPSVRNTLGWQVCVICNSKSFQSFLFKLCLMIVHILKMCTSFFVHVS